MRCNQRGPPSSAPKWDDNYMLTSQGVTGEDKRTPNGDGVVADDIEV